MSKNVKLKRGLSINLLGEADKVYSSVKSHKSFALKPTDFHNLTPKLSVKIGDKVKSGSVVFFDKYNDKINFCSPVSGEVTDIVRGAKRKILEVLINAEEEIKYVSFPVLKSTDLSREQIIDNMLKGGVWPFVRHWNN